MNDPSHPPIQALADQFQTMAQDGPYRIEGFVVFGPGTLTEYRTVLSNEELRERLVWAAEHISL